MPWWLHTLEWTIRAASGLLLILTLLPFVHTGWWVARAADFPRVQLFTLSILVASLSVTLGLLTSGNHEAWLWLSVCTLIAIVQASYIVRFTPLWPTSVESTQDPDLVLVIANLDYRNGSKSEVLATLQSQWADLYLLVEIDDDWVAALAPLRDALPHRVEKIQDEGLGIAMWSHLRLTATDVKHLISEKRPSLHATLNAPNKSINLIGVHPTPPGLQIRGGPKRHDSRIRDAELILVSEHVIAQDESQWIVAGDFNDVAWSRTTSLFAKQSGLLDPRLGRGLLNTFHARYPLLRYPLDHIFVSPGCTIGSLKRIRLPGSDHFAIRAELGLPADSSTETPKSERDPQPEEASDIVDEGREDAADLNRNTAEEHRPAP